jgi:hypothetical protein
VIIIVRFFALLHIKSLTNEKIIIITIALGKESGKLAAEEKCFLWLSLASGFVFVSLSSHTQWGKRQRWNVKTVVNYQT